jgi:4-amino-4-deoxy-L-arabinose transferase-like glycosyltransferase
MLAGAWTLKPLFYPALHRHEDDRSTMRTALPLTLSRSNLSDSVISTQRTRAAWLQRALLAGALSLFVVLGFGYSMVVPPFEKPDEVYHYAFAQLLAGGNPLPVQAGEASGPWSQEGSQPPLYYWMLGRLISSIDLSDYNDVSQLNPHANIGDPLFPGNKNVMLYSAVPRPLAGTNLAVHIGRWLSLLMGTLTLWLIYGIARLVFPRSPFEAWLVLATVAVVPQFAFISSSVSNDILIALLSTAVIYWLARLLTRSDDQPIPWWEWAVLGILFGLAALSKVQGVGLLALIGIVVIGLAWRRHSWKILPEAIALVLLPAAAIAGWWYLRNYRLYGDWLGVVPLFTENGLRARPQTWSGFLGEMRGLRYSFWGLFGWFNILLPNWVYRMLDLLSLIAVAGVAGTLLIDWRQRRMHPGSRPEHRNRTGASQRVMLLLTLWAAMIVGMLVASSFVVLTSQGRLTFPALSAFGVLLVTGLVFWLRLPAMLSSAAESRRVGKEAGPSSDRLLAVLALIPLGLLLCSVYSLTILLPRSYRPLPSVPALPNGVQVSRTRYADHLELVGVQYPGERFRGGQAVPVMLYWKTDAKLSPNYVLFVQLLDEDRRVIANVTSHTGWGRNPTSLWQPGAVYPDAYELAIPGGVNDRAPLLATLYVGFIDPISGTPVQAYDTDGAPTEGMVGRIPLVPSPKGELETTNLTPASVAFEDSIRLAGYTYPPVLEASQRDTGGPSLTVRMLWEAEGQPQGEYTAFVHLVEPGGDPVAGFDRPPADHGFATPYWRQGDRFLSDYTLALPPGLPAGGYQLWAGLYRSDSQGSLRLPVQDADRPALHDRVLLGTIEIE